MAREKYSHVCGIAVITGIYFGEYNSITNKCILSNLKTKQTSNFVFFISNDSETIITSSKRHLKDTILRKRFLNPLVICVELVLYSVTKLHSYVVKHYSKWHLIIAKIVVCTRRDYSFDR